MALIWVNQIKGGEIHEETIGGIDIKRGYGSGYAVRMRGYGSGSGGQKDAAEAAGTAAAAASTAAAGSDGTAEPAKASTADGEPILIGALYPMTGALADSGQNMKDGIDLAVEEINAAGGISGRPIQIVYGDTQGPMPRA